MPGMLRGILQVDCDSLIGEQATLDTKCRELGCLFVGAGVRGAFVAHEM